MKCALKSQTAKILAEALRYCYFDRFESCCMVQRFDVLELFYFSNFIHSGYTTSSDSLVAQAAGGEIDVESLRKEDPSGFDKSEVRK